MKPTATVWICLVLAIGLPGLASAGNTTSFVSGAGDDSAACTRASPCLTFQGALGRTNPGGVITCLDPADFGPVTITQAVSIDCDAARGSIYQAGAGAAVNVQAGAGDAVLLSGLDLKGAGVTGAFEHGIDILSAGSVVIRKSTIVGFSAHSTGGSSLGVGIFDQSNVATGLDVLDTKLSGNATGIVILPSSSTGVSRISLRRVQSVGSDAGLLATSQISSFQVRLSIADSTFSQNGSFGVFVEVSSGGGPVFAGTIATDIANTTITGNAVGVMASGANARVHIGSSVVAYNSVYGLFGGGSTLVSYGDNQIFNNAANLGFTTSPRQ